MQPQQHAVSAIILNLPQTPFSSTTYDGGAQFVSQYEISHGVLVERPLVTYVGPLIVLTLVHRGPAWPQMKKQRELQPLRLLNDDVRNEKHMEDQINHSILGS